MSLKEANKMASKKKNSNYVTDKTSKKKAEAAQKKQAKQKKEQIKSIAIPAVVVLLILAAIFLVIYLGGGFDYIPEATEHVTIQLDGYGTSLHVELYGDDAPITVKQFKSLVSGHYYDGKTLTAYVDGNLYFGGDSEGDGGIKGEFSANGVKNKVPFEVGTLVMARGESYDSGYSKFFVVTENTDISALQGNYAAFGRITGGMDVIEEIIGGLNVGADGLIPVSEQIKITSISSHDSH